MAMTDTVFSRARARLSGLPSAGAALATAAIAVLAIAAPATEALAVPPAHGGGWELVTPPDPNGAPVTSVRGIAAGGERVLYTTTGPLPGSAAGSLQSPSLATRTALGWDSVPVSFPYTVPQFGFASPEIVGASEDMSRLVWSSPYRLTPDSPADLVRGLYVSERGDAAPTLLASVPAGFEFYGGSPDMRLLVFQSETKLLPEDVRTSGRQVYETTEAGLRLAGVDGAGAPLSACGAAVGSNSYPPNPISRDGSRIFISTPACGPARSSVYLREDGTTTDISTSRCTRSGLPCNAPAEVRFMGATPSGSVAFLASAQQLTDDDVDSGQDLYRYERANDVLSRISAGPSGVSAGVVPTAAYSSGDGSRVYFVAIGMLVPGKGVAGRPNVYLRDESGLRFVATLDAADSWATPANLAARREDVQLTLDGERLLFTSVARLTADDTDGSRDVYLYDAGDDTLTRTSGVAGGGNGAFDATIAQGAGTQPLEGHSLRSLSEDGRHVFLQTAEALLPADQNTTSDVYEWEDGDLGLITPGASNALVRYHTASADGSSVFFSTDESLTPYDDDRGYVDLYVARKGGGFPPPEDPPSGACAGPGCPSKPIVRLRRPAPKSLDFLEAPPDVRVLPASVAARRRMAATGWLTLRIRVARPGRIVARARARLGGRTRTIAGDSVKVGQAGAAHLRLRLSPAARRRLDAGHALLVRVTARRSGSGGSSTLRLRLEPPR
jgi:hypothetical protein